ncbi:MAG: 1-deoxy-D-xylulose-5-phosphate reductoisomerase, partial [Candidatus Endobugula sp.]
FPSLDLAIKSAASGIGAATVLNAANEIAVESFLVNKITFGQMTDSLQSVMDQATWNEPSDLHEVIDIDHYSRRLATQVIGELC